MSQENFAANASESTSNNASEADAKTKSRGKERRYPSTQKLWRKSRRSLLIAVLFFAAAHASLNIYASLLLNRELGEIRQKNEPLRLVELAPPAVAESQNAAPLYKQARAALRFSPSEEKLLLKSLHPEFKLNAAEHAALTLALHKNQKAIQLARRAAFQPSCHFPVNWGGPAAQILLPHYAELRVLARWLAAQAVQSARTGDTEGALRDIQAIYRMSGHIQNEPIIIGFLVARALHLQASETLATVLDISPISAARGHSFQTSLPPIDWSAAYRRGMLGERTFTLWGFDTLRSDWRQWRNVYGSEEIAAPAQWLAGPLILLWMPFLKLDEVYALRLWKRTLADTTFLQVPTPINMAARTDRAVQDSPYYAILTRLLFPAFSRMHDHRDAIEVSERQRTIALALSAYRVAQRHYPEHLQEAEASWGQALPLDPYSQRPFVYQRKGQSFTLYSIGPNRIDDGGKSLSHRPAISPSLGDDLVWDSAR